MKGVNVVRCVVKGVNVVRCVVVYCTCEVLYNEMFCVCVTRRESKRHWQQTSPLQSSNILGVSSCGMGGTGTTPTLPRPPHGRARCYTPYTCAVSHYHSYKRSASLSQFVIHRGLIITTMQVGGEGRGEGGRGRGRGWA